MAVFTNQRQSPFPPQFQILQERDSSENLQAITCSSLLGPRVSSEHPSLRVTCGSGNLYNFIGKFTGCGGSDEVLRSPSWTREPLSSFVINKDIHRHSARSLERFPQM